MIGFLTSFANILIDIFWSFIELVKSPFITHACQDCDCVSYSDEAFFMWMKERSRLGSYASEMLAEGIIHRPLKCSTCKHRRERHGTLPKKLLTCDMMPNGGTVHVEMLERERIQKRRDRFGVAEEKRDVEIMELREGDGRVVQNGDDVLCHYDAFVRKSMEKFESSRAGDEFRFTVGNGDVVPGWEKGVIGAKVGGRRRVFVPADLAFGAKMIGGERHVDVVFDIEIVAVMSS